ncbi:hypothetical protein Golomagni_07924 [Golovinomyces magnicellulatus]|nr:hypothetical protein Golomagni_07924 [Golovinomyces magnicellulatus]
MMHIYTNYLLGHNFVDFENSTPVPTLVSQAYGTVLDLGAGSGNQLPRFDADKLDRVYGIEFNPTLIPALNDKIKETGLEDIYTPLVCRVEDADKALEQEGVKAGSVDSIVCIQLLCSIDDITAVVQKLHGLLKPGGEFIFWEHQEHETDWMTRMAQGFWNILWSPVIGHCKLNSPTRKKLLAAVDWEVVELGEDVEGPLDLMPRVWGRLKKKSQD